jgi:hypothetical protein
MRGLPGGDHHCCGFTSCSTCFQKEVIVTLAITLVIESTIITVYALLSKKPLVHLLCSSAVANLFTQLLLWMVLNVFFGHYLVTLFFAELCIWGIESLILYFYPYNRLKLGEAITLSLVMNLASFGIGWFIPV